MKLSASIISLGQAALTALRRVRWRDPLVHAWGLIGGLLVAGMVAHYGQTRKPGEEKNAEWQALQTPGTLTITTPSWKPSVAFTPDATLHVSDPAAEEPDLRAVAGRAATGAGWHYLSPQLRDRLNRLGGGVSRLTVRWSGTSGGNAQALDLYHADTLGQADGAPCDFVIGNGVRGQDGLIEITRRGSSLGSRPAGEITVALIGGKDGNRLTAAQEAALGELIGGVQARCGESMGLAFHRPADPGLLAGLD